MSDLDKKPVFVSEWSETLTGLASWQLEGRRLLNKVIRRYNAWRRDHAVGEADPKEASRIDLLVEEGLQTWASVDGGSQWQDELRNVRSLIQDVLCERG